MTAKRKQHTAALKAQVALAALRGDEAANGVAAQFGARPAPTRDRKKMLLAAAAAPFEGAAQAAPPADARQAEPFEQIGRLKVEPEWVEKELPPSRDWERGQAEPGRPGPSARRRCEPLGLARPDVYYRPAEAPADDLRLMRLLGELHTARPPRGGRRTAAESARRGEAANRERVRRPPRVMGPGATRPRPRPSAPAPGRRAQPYPLRGVAAERPGRAWSAGIACPPPPPGLMYPAAAVDRFSRCVAAWRLPDAPDGSFRREALEEALGRGTPEAFNTGQGAQFTAGARAGRGGGEHGRAGPAPGQRVRRAAVAEREVRGRVPAGVRVGGGAGAGAGGVLPVRRHRAAGPVTRLRGAR